MKVSDIVNKEFTKSVLGYDIREVDVFLDQVIEQIEKLETERKEMITAIEYLLAEIEHIERVSKGGEASPERRAIETAAASRRSEAQAPRQLAPDAGRGKKTPRAPEQAQPASAKEPPARETEHFIQEETVVLEVETGMAAPRRRAVENDMRKLAQESIDEIAQRVERSEGL